jgi:DNA repair protein RadC
MTQAQKTAKEKFKKAIEYRKKTGVSLKEAFAHVYGKKVGAVKKKSVKKKAVKKVARPSRSTKKVKTTYKVNYQTGKSNRTERGINQDAKRKALAPGKRISKSGHTYYETRANRTDFSSKAMTGIGEFRYDKQREIIIGKIGNIKPLESLVPQVKIRLTRGKKVYTNKITTIQSCVDILRKFIGKGQIETQEFFAVMYLNNNNNVLGVYIVGMGGYTSVVAETRLILSAGLRIGATGLVLCHNHPSGNLQPSEADKQVTKKIEAGAKFHDMKVLDHIILTKDGYFSFASDNLI